MLVVVLTVIILWAYLLISWIAVPCPDGKIAVMVMGNGFYCVQAEKWKPAALQPEERGQ